MPRPAICQPYDKQPRDNRLWLAATVVLDYWAEIALLLRSRDQETLWGRIMFRRNQGDGCRGHAGRWRPAGIGFRLWCSAPCAIRLHPHQPPALGHNRARIHLAWTGEGGRHQAEAQRHGQRVAMAHHQHDLCLHPAACP